MQNVSQNKIHSDLALNKKEILKYFPKHNSNPDLNAPSIKLFFSESSTDASQRNSHSLIDSMEQRFPGVCKLAFIDSGRQQKKKRVDYFGKEIKKGGKHKITFADELYFVDKDKNNKDNKMLRNNSFSNYLSENKKIFEFLKSNKRSNSFEINKYKGYKYINSIINNRKKCKKFNNVHIIDFKSTKEENKLNTYLIKKKSQFEDEDNVSCSCYCNIF